MAAHAPARIHLLPAKAARYVVVIRRKPSKLFHIVRWDTRSDEIEHGSWFHGKLYPLHCDISFDGKWMVYRAMGATGAVWNGVCRLPFLRTEMQGETWGGGVSFGGGYWQDAQTLALNRWGEYQGGCPFRIVNYENDFDVFRHRLARDGWERIGDNWGKERRVPNDREYLVECIGDDGWRARPSSEHPYLTMRYVGYLRHGHTYRYALEGSDLLDERVDSACWDALGNLVFSRCGVVYRYSLRDLAGTKPSHVLDLEILQAPHSPDL